MSIGTSDARKNVAEFVLKEQKDLLRYSIDEIAAKIGYILNVLFRCYYARDYEKNRLFKEDRAKVLERNRTAILKEMQEM